MLIRALQSIVIRDAETGELTSIGYGLTAEVEDAVGNELVADGIAEKVESGGGGGSSDFSTAKVTINVNPPDGVELSPDMTVYAIFGYPREDEAYSVYLSINNHEDSNIVLYKGTGYIKSLEVMDTKYSYYQIKGTPVTTGGVAYEEHGGDAHFVVTGDGTISCDVEKGQGPK